MTAPRHFLTGEELSSAELNALLDRAIELKAGRDAGVGGEVLDRKSVALYFQQRSTRTRISFAVGVAELGGNPVSLREDELQIGRGESVRDTARMLSRFVHGVVIRAASHELVSELATECDVPVINGLTSLHHPCQVLADLMTLKERFGDLNGLKLAYLGDGNNVTRSLGIVGGAAGVEVVVGAPEGHQLDDGVVAYQMTNPAEAVAGADAVYTDVWVSLADDEAVRESRVAALSGYQLNDELMAAASDRAVALHCLPAHPGEEITESVLYGDRSAVWDQAENRLHAQKALLELLLT